jgi:RimJ/RimL family protein N-acetyltransferase
MKYNFAEEYILENDRALLRPLKPSDIDYLFPFAVNEPEIWKYSLSCPNDLESMQKFIDKTILKRNQDKTEYPFIVFDKLKNNYAGSTRFYNISLENKSLNIGYTWYGKNFQGTGLNKQCKELLLSFAFNQMDIERIEFQADSENKRSIAAMISIGCKLEGKLRSHLIRPNGTRRDSVVLSILKSEWEKK